MSELLKEVLVNKAARGTEAKKVAIAKSANNFAPWGWNGNE